MTESTYPRRRGSKINKPDETNDVKVEYTEEQLTSVQRVRNCKDYYEILGVDKDAGDSELRKQYKKLALQFHPDKNKTPGAVEAFKVIGTAFAVLSDTEKRKQYDMYGLEGAQRMHSQTANGEYAEYSAFQGDISPEDLFNMFFGAGFSSGGTTYVRRGNQWQRYGPRTNHTHHQQQHHHYTRQQEESRGVLLQIMPLIILISISFLSNLFVSDPLYSLTRNTKYIIERRTPNLEVPYYVKETFDNEFKSRIPSIEKDVEDEYLMSMRSACHRERNYKESMIWRAKTFRDLSLVEKAQRLRTPSCDALNEIYSNMERVY